MKNRNDRIVENVWNATYLKAVTSQADIDRICESTYEAWGTDGPDGYNACQSATSSCMTDPSQCNDSQIWEKYSQALATGYSDTFSKFKKRSSIAGFLTSFGQIAQGFFQNKQAPQTVTSVVPEPSRNITPFIVGGVLLIAAVGTGIYFYNKNK